ncbi:unannotated protein [freshwater metagenome]|uniref:Unannotated protein n=1 Tax=freshwater metagenome TaxID=449393 RepID=A0A6J7DTH4_9ZZZZ
MPLLGLLASFFIASAVEVSHSFWAVLAETVLLLGIIQVELRPNDKLSTRVAVNAHKVEYQPKPEPKLSGTGVCNPAPT